MDRVILHCDLNSFYASVELLDHPELRDRPVAVCGDPNSRHGIILAKNEPAKRYKVQTAETIWQARRKCPELVLLPAHHWKYRDYSRRVNAVYERYTDLVEPFSIDESWLDITGSLHLFGGDAKALADEIRGKLLDMGIVLNHGKIEQLVKDNVAKLSIKTPSSKTTIQSLSGGNQQKVIISRWLANNPDVLIMDEPTRGIDVGAKYEIYQIMINLAKQGKAIIMISSEMPELIGMSDRIMVMCNGRITGEVSGEEATQENIMSLATKF